MLDELAQSDVAQRLINMSLTADTTGATPWTTSIRSELDGSRHSLTEGQATIEWFLAPDGRPLRSS
jgi:hypothetical protein